MAKNKKLNTRVSNIFETSSAEQTRKIGGEFSKLLKKGDIIFLKGDLGSGKTTFTQGVVNAFGNKGFARSSSFMLVCEYSGANAADKLFHLDLYRLSQATVWDIGIEEYIYGDNISIIEWADRLVGVKPNWLVEMEYVGDNNRKITIECVK
ncbi:tRNA (adenosine(37)-N6)-threonylcarbamoyltransferase complex ATPase subunit type 1 TsaE [Endomicrobium proavitum]|uniref:tRNA threonylcarbamoyladenosine biosynthesis protein TsaE n=1 Tax=Endomicrobium proavitum TaxID=1408281 RepID=A0A0G3WFK4_9BACT|nr:tRNA (adenosine(37)-N6)-threonylcarbamoyltransferase complex ATPase subunit type 1 TsaE [Endomicrobium proavitum]AKL97436.1 ATP/GTP hydrolase [Endomicrobium proavitum]